MFSKFELTNKGVELLNRSMAESKTLKFTKFQIGKGEFSGDKKTLTQLVSKFDEFNVTEKNVLPNNITNIKGFYDNRNVSVVTKFTEIGIMAQLGDDSLTEVLFSYANQPTDEAETIPSKESYFSRTFSVINRTDNVTSITFDLKIRQDKYNFGTLAEMKAADYLDIGDKVALWGNEALGDSSFKMYIITNQSQEIQLNNLLYAKEYFKIVNDLTTTGDGTVLDGRQGKILDDKKFNKGNVPDVLNSAEKIIKALQGNTGIKFDENLLYLNDAGTKKKGYCYIDKLTDGIFECIQGTTTTVNNATYFKNFSNKENSDRLSNLITFNSIKEKLIFRFEEVQVTTPTNKTVINFKTPFPNACIAVIVSDNASQYGDPVIFGASVKDKKSFYLSSSDKTSTNHICCIFSVGY